MAKIIGSALPNMPWEPKPEGCTEPVWRYSKNPIINRFGNKRSNSVFNSAVVPFEDGYAGVFRCDSRSISMDLFAGRSKNALDWEINDEPLVFEDDCDPEVLKKEYRYDARITPIEDKYYITWCNGYHGPTIGVGWTKDFKTFHQLENAYLPFNRNGVLFPRKINGMYMMMRVFEGMAKAIFGETVESVEPVSQAISSETAMEHADIMSLGSIEFAYCTEFFIINLKKQTTLADIERFREFLMTIGDSVIAVGDLDFVKVHVHTNKPGVALTKALELGELDRLKIENMLEQNRALMKKYEEEKKPMGMMAVSAGDGITSIFKDLMVDAIVEGGQTLNPSANDIANAVSRINAENVFVFPNNKNIILAAEQAKSLVDNKKIHVIPTKNIPQGFAAALAFNPELPVDENKANMIHALDSVTVGQVTYAVRNTKMDGFELKVGDIMGLDNKKILSIGKDISEVTFDLIEKIRSGEEIITLYYGKDVKEEEAETLAESVRERFPDCDVEVHYGGQPVYYYYVALE